MARVVVERFFASLVASTLLLACERRTTPEVAPSVAGSTGQTSSSRAQPSASSAAAPSLASAESAAADVDAVAPASPLGPPGATIAIAQEGRGELHLLVTEAGKTTTYAFTEERWDEKPPYRHVDVDGDGRADTVIFLPKSDEDSNAFADVILTPPQGAHPANGDVQYDVAAAIVSIGASSLDEAVARAKAIRPKGVTRDAARALLLRARTKAGFRTVATPDARLFAGGPSDWAHERIVSLADLDSSDVLRVPSSGEPWWPLADAAHEWLYKPPESGGLEEHRPMCTFGQANAVVFAWAPDGQLRIQAVAYLEM